MDMTDLKDRLETWEREGLMSPEQASRILEFEGAGPSRGFPPWMEAVSYLGAALVLLAIGLLAGQFWDELEAFGQVSLSAIVTALLLAVGWFLLSSEEPAARRAGGFAWLLSLGGIALTGSVTGDRLLDLREERVFLLGAAATLALAIPLWIRNHSLVQLLGMGAATGATVIAVMGQFDFEVGWGFGVALGTAGAVWLLLTWGGILTPVRTSYGIGAFGLLLVGFPELFEGTMPWPVIGLVAALLLIAMAVRLEQRILLGFGLAGVFVYVWATVNELFGGTVGVVVALMIVGIALLTWILLRTRARTAG